VLISWSRRVKFQFAGTSKETINVGSWKLRIFAAAFAGISSAGAAGVMETGVGP